MKTKRAAFNIRRAESGWSLHGDVAIGYRVYSYSTSTVNIIIITLYTICTDLVTQLQGPNYIYIYT